MRYWSHRGGSLIRSDTDDQRFRAATALAALVIMGVGLYLRFAHTPEPPALPARPKGAERGALRDMEYSQSVYQARIERDATEAGVAASPAELAAVFPHQLDEERRELTRDTPLDVGRLRLTARVVRLDTQVSGGTIPVDHLVLRIENLGDTALAYRVDTVVGAKAKDCMGKADLAHDALTLAPRGVAERTECVVTGPTPLAVKRVETIAIPPLASFYIARLYPAHVGVDRRTSRGHEPVRGGICQNIPEQAIRQTLARGEASWRDVIDFYGRHNCEHYMFPSGYHAFTKAGERPLPVSREAAGGAR